MNATSARETFMSIGTYPNRTVSDRLSSRRPWSLNEDGRDCDPSLSRGNVSQSQQHTPRQQASSPGPDNLGCLPERFDSSRPFRVALGVEHHSEASHP